jgi:hypothetical protein
MKHVQQVIQREKLRIVKDLIHSTKKSARQQIQSLEYMKYQSVSLQKFDGKRSIHSIRLEMMAKKIHLIPQFYVPDIIDRKIAMNVKSM